MRLLPIALLVVTGCASPGLRARETSAPDASGALARPAPEMASAPRPQADSGSDAGVTSESHAETVDAASAHCPREESAISAEIRERMGKYYTFEQLERPRDVLYDIEPVRTLVNELLCYGSKAASTASDEVEAWAARLEEWVVQEEKCRASPACFGARIHSLLCDMVADRLEIVDAVAGIKASSMTTTDAMMVRALSERLASLDARMTKSKAQFKSTLHRAFDPHSCPIRLQEI